MAVTMTGARRLPASPDVVFAALTDVECLRLCVPACRSLDQTSETTFAIGVLVTLGPVRLVCDGTIEMVASVPGRAIHLRGRGGGGLVGEAVGTMRLNLHATPDGTRLDYQVEADASGPLAALGTPFLTATAKTMADQFVLSLRDVLTGRASAAQSAGSGAVWRTP